MNLPMGRCSGHGLVELLNKEEVLRGIEIGCANGDTTYHLLSSLPNIQLIGIDPYVDYVDWNTNNIHNQEQLYIQFKQRICNQFPNRFTLYRMTSDDAVTNFQDESLDFIFIDGLHTYEQVKQDCLLYYPKIKKGGLFAGHDYTVIEAVGNAVREFSKSIGNSQIFTTDYDVWYWFK